MVRIRNVPSLLQEEAVGAERITRGPARASANDAGPVGSVLASSEHHRDFRVVEEDLRVPGRKVIWEASPTVQLQRHKFIHDPSQEVASQDQEAGQSGATNVEATRD